MQPTVHTVAAGDTLSSIGAKYGVSYQDIAKANNISNPNVIYPGQKFTIPGAAPSLSATPAVPKVAPIQNAQPTSQPASQNTSQGGASPPSFAPNTVDQTVFANGVTWKGQPGGQWVAQSGGESAGLSAATPAPHLDLVALTNSSYNTPEITAANQAITDANTELTARQQALVDAQANINDNPFFSEATRVGKSAKLTDRANADINIIQNKVKLAQDKVTSLKADAAIKVNAALGQYNIDEKAYQDTLANFDKLVSNGALDNASGSDIANLALQTGIPTSMIQSIQQASQKKNNPLSIVQATDNEGNLTILSVDKNGAIQNQTTIPGVNKSTKSSGTETDTPPSTAKLKADAGAAAKSGKTYTDMLSFFVGQGLAPTDVYKIYTAANYYKRPPDNVDPKTGLPYNK